MLSFRNTDNPTHTIDAREGFIEAFLLGLDDRGNGIWLDPEKGIHTVSFRNALPIPGADQLHQVDMERVATQPRIPFHAEYSLEWIVRLFTNNWRTIRSATWDRVKIESPDRIVRKNGSPWIIKSRAQRILNELHLTSTHIVDGFGNKGPRGREWWIRPKTTYFPAINYVLNSYHMPFDQWHMYTIEIPFDKNPDCDLEGLLWELGESRKHWGYKIRREGDCFMLGFSSEAAYSDFIVFAINKSVPLLRPAPRNSDLIGQEGCKPWRRI